MTLLCPDKSLMLKMLFRWREESDLLGLYRCCWILLEPRQGCQTFRISRKISGFLRKLPDFSGFWIFFIWWIMSQLFIYILESLNDSIEVRVLLQFSHTLALTLTLIAAFNVLLSLKVWLNCRRNPLYCEHHRNFSKAFTIRRCSVVVVLLYNFSHVIHYQ
jgi:hypothetical protein